jgi:toxin ParE1/3/4
VLNWANVFLKDLLTDAKKLINFPEMGRVYVEFDPNIRGLPLDGYVIFYRATKAEIEIIRVISGRQNLQALFSDDINY